MAPQNLHNPLNTQQNMCEAVPRPKPGPIMPERDYRGLAAFVLVLLAARYGFVFVRSIVRRGFFAKWDPRPICAVLPVTF